MLIEHNKIRAVTLTGSTDAGKKVAEKAGACLKKTVLELGGSDAYLILKDADIENAAKTCAQSRLLNSGQSCIAAKRFIVVDEVYDEFVAAFKDVMAKKIMGDPNKDDTDVGPMNSVSARDALHEQVQKTVKAGAKCIIGGEIPDGEGAWYPPTILADVTEGMPAYKEEIFGPVAIVIRAKDDDDAVAISNSSEFGLGGGVFTSDIDHGMAIARNDLDTGSVAVNNFVKSNPHLPFGGVKNSGYGRELSCFGIREFVNIKTVTVTKP
jgi:succinate-semialdehyde dehydrogenase/glutarate-semialdehyde dehydrogenase